MNIELEAPQPGTAARDEDPAAGLATDLRTALGLTGLSALSASLAACGGGGDGSDAAAAALGTPGAGDTAGAPGVPPVPPPPRLTPEQASHFLGQAAFGGTAADIASVRALGQSGWLNDQFTQPQGTSYVDLISPGGPDVDATDGRVGVERALWRKFISYPDVLRQRVTLALSEIFVISIIPVVLPQRGFASAAFMDILERNAFGNYRDLLLQVSRCAAMGSYLTFLNNKKANPTTGSQPDENYAREVMQLFSIGLIKLQINGEPLLLDGKAQDAYTQSDVTEMARVFTGWILSRTRPGPYDLVTRPMDQNPAQHDTGAKTVLGKPIDANGDGAADLARAVEILMDHPNIGPFVGRQLIQRLVTSQPSKEYVERVAKAFNGTGGPDKGDMKATIRAVLLDPEAASAASLLDNKRGKLREPMVRFMQWARTFGLSLGPNGRYDIGNLSDPTEALAQSPLRSPSVFNFFRPGFVPPNTALGAAKITAPEFQITTESSVAGYVNFMQRVIANGIAGSVPNYATWLPLANDTAALLAELNVVLAAGQISTATLARMKVALDTVSAATDASRRRRLQAALLLVLATPEYVVQK